MEKKEGTTSRAIRNVWVIIGKNDLVNTALLNEKDRRLWGIL